MKRRSSDLLKFVAMLSLDDRYARRKLSRRFRFLLLGAALLAVAAPSSAAQRVMTEEDLQGFLSGKTSIEALTSGEGEAKTDTKAVAARATAAPTQDETLKRLKEVEARQGRFVYDDASKTRRFIYPDARTLPEGAKAVDRKFTGTVGAKIHSGMEFVYEKSRASHSLWIDFTKGIAYKGVKGPEALGTGDEIEVSLRETEDGGQRVVTGVRLVRKLSEEERKRRTEAELVQDRETLSSGAAEEGGR